MRYNKTSEQYETPPLAVWFSTEAFLGSRPITGLETWLELLIMAKHPW
jgi:hypothetical protein